MTEGKIKKLQRIQLDILKCVHSICKEHDINYCLIGGTLLGAIRHKGFIPWDDDIDIAMPRRDYEKFLKLCKTELPQEYILQCNKDPLYHMPIAKVRKRGTKYVEQSVSQVNTSHEIWIDIFPLDNASKQSSCMQKIQGIIVKKLKLLIRYRYNIQTEKTTILKKWITNSTRILPISIMKKILNEVMQWNKNGDSDYFVNLGSQYNYYKQTILKAKYFPFRKVEFEGTLFYAPNDYDFILSRIYGNYMELPPKEERVNHNPVEILFENEEKNHEAIQHRLHNRRF